MEIVDRHPQSEGAQPRDGWPTRCTRIGSRPDAPEWVGGPDATGYYAEWANLVRARVLSLAQTSASLS